MEGKNVVPDVWQVLDKIKAFSERVRSGEWVGVTGKPIKNVVAVGIGGSFLGPLFVHTALRWVVSVLLCTFVLDCGRFGGTNFSLVFDDVFMQRWTGRETGGKTTVRIVGG